jgi:hypothetical protein
VTLADNTGGTANPNRAMITQPVLPGLRSDRVEAIVRTLCQEFEPIDPVWRYRPFALPRRAGLRFKNAKQPHAQLNLSPHSGAAGP